MPNKTMQNGSCCCLKSIFIKLGISRQACPLRMAVEKLFKALIAPVGFHFSLKCLKWIKQYCLSVPLLPEW